MEYFNFYSPDYPPTVFIPLYSSFSMKTRWFTAAFFIIRIFISNYSYVPRLFLHSSSSVLFSRTFFLFKGSTFSQKTAHIHFISFFQLYVMHGAAQHIWYYFDTFRTLSLLLLCFQKKKKNEVTAKASYILHCKPCNKHQRKKEPNLFKFT